MRRGIVDSEKGTSYAQKEIKFENFRVRPEYLNVIGQRGEEEGDASRAPKGQTCSKGRSA